MTPGPSFTVPSTLSPAPAAPAESHPVTSSSSASVAAPNQQNTSDESLNNSNTDAVYDTSAGPSNSTSAGLRRTDLAAPVQPKHCAHCGLLLDAVPSSHDRQPGLARTSSSASISAPSPSSYAFAPDSIRSQHRLQPHQSLTSAINAAAVVALSRILGNDEPIPTDADGHAICAQCADQLAGSATSSAITDTQQRQSRPVSHAIEHSNLQSGSATAGPANTSLLADDSLSRDAPQTRLTISVDNMGAGGDAAMTQSVDDVHMQDPSSFPPLERAPITPALRAPPSPSGAGRSASRGRIRFADTPDFHAADAHEQGHARTSVTPSSALGRSGSFSRSLSYNGSESVSSSSAPVVVSFPASLAATPASEDAPSSSVQSTHPLAPSASSSALTSNPQPRSRSSSNVHASGALQSHVASAGPLVSGGLKQRRPSSARRLSRSSSSTGPTTISFAAAGSSVEAAAVSSTLPKDDDPFGPGAVTRPRLSDVPTQIIADELYSSARHTRPASLISGSTSTSLAASSAQQAAGIDPTRAVRYHLDPLAFPERAPTFARSADGKKREDEAVGMDIDDDKVSNGLAAKWGGVRWFDAYKPDPLAELSRLRNPPRGRGCLYPGATFNGTQKSGRNSYDVTVRVVNVDLEASHLCGYLNIRGLTEDWPELTTYFDAEIIGDRYGFVTGKWGATEADDLKHWARFAPFRPLRSALSKPGLRFNHLNKPFVFMRWKEKFLVPDHRVRDINGASFAGFYYVCVELGEGAGRGEGRGRRDSDVSMTSGNGAGGLSNASSPVLNQASTAVGGPAVSGQQWYAARTQRRRELSLSSPTSNPVASTQTYYHPIYHPHSPLPPSGPGFWPASPTSPHMPFGGAGEGGREDAFATMFGEAGAGAGGGMVVEDDLGAMGRMSGFYFHENSEPYQQLSLHHTAEASSSGFEMR
ncbi:Vacuolar import and degradation protein 24 [Pseudozyma hubeiensis]|nr:Vacuolar import and degradation protein 24 [Pseudozyma hubeiensis]